MRCSRLSITALKTKKHISRTTLDTFFWNNTAVSLGSAVGNREGENIPLSLRDHTCVGRAYGAALEIAAEDHGVKVMFWPKHSCTK